MKFYECVARRTHITRCSWNRILFTLVSEWVGWLSRFSKLSWSLTMINTRSQHRQHWNTVGYRPQTTTVQTVCCNFSNRRICNISQIRCRTCLRCLAAELDFNPAGFTVVACYAWHAGTLLIWSAVHNVAVIVKVARSMPNWTSNLEATLRFLPSSEL